MRMMLVAAVPAPPAVYAQELGRTQPQLVQQINQHHDEFLRLLTEAGEGDEEEGDEVRQLLYCSILAPYCMYCSMMFRP